jgi:DNA helicase II / ATP-dependent DNA helicase PcrA
MMLIAVRILERNPKILAKYHEKWNYLLQDEAQDASPLQWHLLTLLTNKKANIFAVGDSSQCIMSFNGAEIGLIQNFEKQFRGITTKLYPLLNNYRSHKTIIDVANAVERELVGNHPAPMISKAKILPGTPALSYIEYPNSVDESRAISETILRLASPPENPKLNKFLATPQGQLYARRGQKPIPITNITPLIPMSKSFELRDIAILVRSKIMIPTIENALLMKHIPYYVRDGKSLLQSKEVMDLLAYLRLCVNPYDAASFERAVQVPKRGFGDESIKKLIKQAKVDSIDILSLANTQARLLTFASYIDLLRSQITADPKEISTHLDNWYSSSAVQYESEIKKTSAKNTDDELRRVENFNRFKLLLQEIMDEGIIENLADMLDHISLMQDAGAANSDANKVQIMTAHSVKGLEYGVVFAPCFFEGSIPHHRSKTQADIDEEARLTYVIVTRAIKQLRISRPIIYATRGSAKPMRTSPSRFLEPMIPFFSNPANIL